jgi:hypothetical protein
MSAWCVLKRKKGMKSTGEANISRTSQEYDDAPNEVNIPDGSLADDGSMCGV